MFKNLYTYPYPFYETLFPFRLLVTSLPVLQGQTISPSPTNFGTQGQTGVSPSGTNAGTQGQTGVSPSGTTAGTQAQGGTSNTATATQGQSGTSNGTIALSSPIIVDDGNTGFTAASLAVRTVVSGQPAGFGQPGDSRELRPNVWAFNSVTPGTFDVYATWVAAPTNSTAATYSLFSKVGDVRTLIETFTVDQTQAPADATHTGDSRWKKLTRVTVTTGQKLVVSGALEQNAYIDAIALQRVPFADVSITKTAPATVAPGANLAYTLTLLNTSTTDGATNITITDPIPAGLSFTGAAGASCAVSADELNVVCSGITIAAATGTTSRSKTVTLRYSVPSESTCGSAISSDAATVATATQETSTTNNESAAVTTDVLCAAGDLAVTMTAPGTVTRGQVLLYTVTVTNQGPTDVTARIADRVPVTGLIFLADQSSTKCKLSAKIVTCSEISLVAGSSTTRTIAFTVPASFTCPALGISNTARVSSNVTDPNSGNNETDAVLTTCQ
ncbi:MAG: hypothetical protein Greene101449_1331 [Candidatus Peregrinibacteria bacterium Greene1014_49]|nr:MAG: hypothetical protein Greene101449_1331 [Candidatus Peregrinibacteria bacterium Greene1014_49]